MIRRADYVPLNGCTVLDDSFLHVLFLFSIQTKRLIKEPGSRQQPVISSLQILSVNQDCNFGSLSKKDSVTSGYSSTNLKCNSPFITYAPPSAVAQRDTWQLAASHKRKK